MTEYVYTPQAPTTPQTQPPFTQPVSQTTGQRPAAEVFPVIDRVQDVAQSESLN